MVAIDPAQLEKGVAERQNVVHLKHKVNLQYYFCQYNVNKSFTGASRGRRNADSGCNESHRAKLEGVI